MATGRLHRLELAIPSVVRGRLHRLELTVPATGQRGRLHRLELSTPSSGTVVQIVATPAYPQRLVTVTATIAATVTTWEILQLPDYGSSSTTTVTLTTTTPGVWTFAAPATYVGVTLVFEVRALIGTIYTSYTVASLVVPRHHMWSKVGGTIHPIGLLPAYVPPDQIDPSPGLFFALPTTASPKLLLAHFFGPYPITFANDATETDYYSRNYLNPTGGTDNPAFGAVGGLLRTRPIGRDVLPIDQSWQNANAREEIRQAMSVGIDGFFVNCMNLSGANNQRYYELRDVASAEHPGFYVVPMLDVSTASSLRLATTAQIADLVQQFAGKASTLNLPNATMMVGAFEADTQTLAWWTDLLSILSGRGIQCSIVGAYNAYATGVTAHKSFLYAAGQWGFSADPGIETTHADVATYVRGVGVKYMSDVWHQDIRPTAGGTSGNGWWEEARNTEQLRAAWGRTITDNADIVQLTTWSDYSEGGQFNNSEHAGLVFADIGAYYAAKWKTGAFPTILTDALYLTYRQVPLSAVPTGTQTYKMVQRVLSGSSTPREQVEALVFLTAPADVKLTVGGVTTTYTNVPAGMTAHLVSQANGTVSGEVWRNGIRVINLVSPIPIQTSWPNDHRDYVACGSIRGTAGQKASWPR